jgi:hypothetical protein
MAKTQVLSPHYHPLRPSRIAIHSLDTVRLIASNLGQVINVSIIINTFLQVINHIPQLYISELLQL